MNRLFTVFGWREVNETLFAFSAVVYGEENLEKLLKLAPRPCRVRVTEFSAPQQ